ncbi:porphobilinogen deaminase [Spirochaetia bacterium]|nr:porphobilinogen deaminase [Spirochaetia bacterium]
MTREIRFGSRESALAIAQTRLIMDPIAKAHPELTLHLVTMKTQGDLHPEWPLEGINSPGGGKGLFTGALEQALAEGRVDLCVHSLKDMAESQTEDLPIIGMAHRGDPRDMLLLPVQAAVSGAAPSPVGCSSLRRRLQFLACAPGMTVSPIRGNVPTRLAKLDQGQYGALILAAAGIHRLCIRGRPGYYFPVRTMVPAAGQGTLAIQGRRGEDYGFLDAVLDPVTGEEALAERTLIRALGGGCDSPAGAYARISGSEIFIIAMYAANKDAPLYKEELSGPRDRALMLADELARRLLQKGEGR